MGILNNPEDRVRHYISDFENIDNDDPVGWLIDTHKMDLLRIEMLELFIEQVVKGMEHEVPKTVALIRKELKKLQASIR